MMVEERTHLILKFLSNAQTKFPLYGHKIRWIKLAINGFDKANCILRSRPLLYYQNNTRFVYKKQMETQSDVMNIPQVLSEAFFSSVRAFTLCAVVFRVINVDHRIWINYAAAI